MGVHEGVREAAETSCCIQSLFWLVGLELWNQTHLDCKKNADVSIDW